MNTASGSPGTASFHHVVRIGGVLAAVTGMLAVLGWALQLPLLASFGFGNIPMAPSTALLLVLYGIAVSLRGRLTPGPGTYRVGVVLGSAGGLVAVVLAVLSFRGIHPDAEHFGLVIDQTVGGAPVGHMSPVTATCLLLASLSLLSLSWRPSSDSRRFALVRAAFWIAGLLLVASFVLLLAYLFGAPLLYGGPFIPPAATTSFAFVALGTALLALAEPEARSLGDAARRAAWVPYPLVLLFALLAAAIIAIGGLYYRTFEQHFRVEGERELSSIADSRSADLARWRGERLGDAATLFENTAFAALVRRVFDGPQDGQAREQLQSWLTELQAHQEYDGVFLFDDQGAERMAIPAQVAPASTVVVQRLQGLLRSREGPVFQDFYRNEHDGRIYLDVLLPIVDGPFRNRSLGALALRVDPSTFLYPFLARWPRVFQTADTQLVRRDGDAALYLNPAANQTVAALNRRVPLDRVEVPAVKAVLTQQGIVEGRDERGVPVLAALGAVTGSPWFVVVRVDAAEVNAPLRARMWVTVAFIGGMLIAVAGVTVGLWRHQRANYYRERYEERRRADAEKHEARRLLESVINGTPDAVYVKDLQGRYLLLNATVERFAGKSAAAVLGKDDTFLFPPAEAAALMEADRAVIASGSVTTYEEVLRDAAGALVTFLSTKGPLFDEGGRPVGLFGVAHDITERKGAEEALRASEARYRAVNESAREAIITTDAEGTIVGWNPSAARLFGYTAAEVLQRPVSRLIPPGFRDVHLAGLERRRTNGEKHLIGTSTEVEGLRQDGTTFPVRISLAEWETQEGRFYTGILSDLSAAHKADEMRRLLEAQLRQSQKVEAIGTLAGGIAHDFNNLLTAIMGNTELALVDADQGLSPEPRIREIARASERATELVRQILTFSRRQPAVRTPVRMRPVVEEALKLLRATIPASVELATRFDGEASPVLADRSQIHQIIVNLCTNSWQALGGKAGRVEVRVEELTMNDEAVRAVPGLQPGRHVRLRVSDTGSGIDPSIRERIFDPFFTTKAVGEGTGLGLSVVLGIVKEHGGAITVTSEPGRGTTFDLYMPALNIPSPIAGEAQASSNAPPRGRGQRVLYLDDEESLVQVAIAILERRGYLVSGYTSAVDALEAVTADPGGFDLLIADLNMPDLSGLEVAHAVLRVRADLPIVLVSGNFPGDMPGRAAAVGILDLVTKPYTAHTLHAAVHRHVASVTREH